MGAEQMQVIMARHVSATTILEPSCAWMFDVCGAPPSLRNWFIMLSVFFVKTRSASQAGSLSARLTENFSLECVRHKYGDVLNGPFAVSYMRRDTSSLDCVDHLFILFQPFTL